MDIVLKYIERIFRVIKSRVFMLLLIKHNNIGVAAAVV